MRGVGLALALAVLGSSACFRLSDPIYAFKPLRAQEPPGAEHSLVVLTVLDEGSLTSPIDTIYLRRVDPAGEGDMLVRSAAVPYRVFDRRTVKDGHFLLNVPPGAYEFDRLASLGGWFKSEYLVARDAKQATRFHITRPGIRDLGTFRIVASGGLVKRYDLVAVGDAGSEQRREMIGRAIKGTGWTQR